MAGTKTRGKRAVAALVVLALALGLFAGLVLALPVRARAATPTAYVTNAATSGAGSLRTVLENAGPGDVVDFDLPPGSRISQRHPRPLRAA